MGLERIASSVVRRVGQFDDSFGGYRLRMAYAFVR